MKVYHEIDVEDFEFWAGARDRMNTATEEQRKRVFDRIEDVFFYEEFVNETAINDMVWFDCDDIFYPDEEEEEE